MEQPSLAERQAHCGERFSLDVHGVQDDQVGPVALAVAQRMTSVGGKVAICSANADVTEVFDVGGFVAVFDMHPSAESATARLSED